MSGKPEFPGASPRRDHGRLDGGLQRLALGHDLRWSPFLGQETGLAKRESRRFLIPLPVCGDDASGYHFILIN